MQIPVSLSFGVNDTSVAKLQALSACVQFVSVYTSAPCWRYYRTATLSIPATTFTQIPFTAVAADSDGHWTSPGITTITTQGYYACEAMVPYEGTASTYVPQTIFQWTAGPSNPHYSSGTQQYFGGHSSGTFGAAGTDYCQCISDKCPVVCFPGDTIVVKTWCSVAATLNYESNANGTSGWFAPSFSGRWVRTGS